MTVASAFLKDIKTRVRDGDGQAMTGWNMAGDLHQGPRHSGKEVSLRHIQHPLTSMHTWEATVRKKQAGGGRGARLLEPLCFSFPSPYAMVLGWYFEVSWAGLGMR